MAYVVAVPANPALIAGIEEFISAVEHQRGNSAELYIRMVDFMTDRMLSLFMVEPARMVELSNTQKKIIDFAVTTAGKASHMLTRQIYKKVTNKEFAPIAARFADLYWPAGEDNDNQAHIHFPVDDVFAIEFKKVAEQCACGSGEEAIETMSAVMDRLADEIIENFFVASNSHVKIGFITQKAVNIGIDGSLSAIRAVNHKVLKGLNAEQLKDFMGHYAPIVRAL